MSGAEDVQELFRRVREGQEAACVVSQVSEGFLTTLSADDWRRCRSMSSEITIESYMDLIFKDRRRASQRPPAVQPQPSHPQGARQLPVNVQYAAGANAQVRHLFNRLKARVSEQQMGAPQMASTNGQGSFRHYAPAVPYVPHASKQAFNGHAHALADRIVTDSIRMGFPGASGQGALVQLLHAFEYLHPSTFRTPNAQKLLCSGWALTPSSARESAHSHPPTSA
jgi:hypothetical protein